MSTTTFVECCNTVAEVGGAMASALSDAGRDFTEQVATEGGRAVVTAERQAEILAQTMARQILRAANNCRLAAEIVGGNPATAALMGNIADAFAAKAVYLTGNTVSADARIASVAAEAQEALQAAASKWGGALGSFGQAAGPIIDAAQMVAGAWEWGTTGNSNAFGAACGGVIMSWCGGLAIGGLAAFVAPAAGGLTIALAVGLGAGIGTFLGEPFYKLLKAGADKLFGLLDDHSIADNFNAAQAWVRRVDPLILDLDGDGIETVGLNANNPLLFDHDGDGVKTSTGWIKADDGLLVLDRNGNGIIDNGTELFGDSTPLVGGGYCCQYASFSKVAGRKRGAGANRHFAGDHRFSEGLLGKKSCARRT